MKHTYWLSGLAVPFCLPQQAMAEKQPHIIFIMTDQQRGDAIGCAGNDRIITPNIDALAEDGFLFNNAYSATPSSTPARAGLLTGLSPWHHGMLGYGNVAEHYKFEMPQMLRDHGYLTPDTLSVSSGLYWASRFHKVRPDVQPQVSHWHSSDYNQICPEL